MVSDVGCMEALDQCFHAKLEAAEETKSLQPILWDQSLPSVCMGLAITPCLLLREALTICK